MLANDDLLLGLSLGFFDLAAAHGTLLALQTNVVVQQDRVDLLRLRGLDHCLPRLVFPLLLLSVFFVGGSTSVLVLHNIASESEIKLSNSSDMIVLH